MTKGLVKQITVEESTSIQWVKSSLLFGRLHQPCKQQGNNKSSLPLKERFCRIVLSKGENFCLAAYCHKTELKLNKKLHNQQKASKYWKNDTYVTFSR